MGTWSHAIQQESNQYHLMKISFTELKMTYATAWVEKADLPAVMSHPWLIRTSYKKFETSGIKMHEHDRLKPQK